MYMYILDTYLHMHIHISSGSRCMGSGFSGGSPQNVFRGLKGVASNFQETNSAHKEIST